MMRSMVFTLAVLLASPAIAHEWLEDTYTIDGKGKCCFATDKNGRPPDCVVTRARFTPGGWLFVSPFTDDLRPGPFLAPSEMIQPSQDRDFWICWLRGEPKPRCVFVPGTEG